MACIAWLSKLSIWQSLIEAIQELICLKGALMMEIGIHPVDPITFMDDVKSAITWREHTYDDRMIDRVTRTWGGRRSDDESVTI